MATTERQKILVRIRDEVDVASILVEVCNLTTNEFEDSAEFPYGEENDHYHHRQDAVAAAWAKLDEWAHDYASDTCDVETDRHIYSV